MDEAFPFLIAAGGGVLPTFLWLWFWLREDSKHPEPRKLIALAFLAGMVAVGLVIPIEQWVAGLLVSQTLIFVAWSAIEELMKFAVAWITVLRRRENDEPIDPIIYMLAVALGFAAAENTLFLLSPLSGISLSQTIITGDFRFVGATLLHVLASSAIGASLAFSFYRPWRIRVRYLLAGVILSILLHGLFNFLIMNTAPEHMIRTFAFVWLGLIALLALLEFIKRIPRHR
ncbi:MAG TPA: PrsW family glutamic-type intramembrane protease [Candidatus Paceibacterota bacterium]